MNVKRTKQENERTIFYPASSDYIREIPNPKAARTPDMNEKEKRQGTLIFFYC